jgi:diguanylate cyclase (GGDEF)-like protein/PAS domain S-box-containing protein
MTPGAPHPHPWELAAGALLRQADLPVVVLDDAMRVQQLNPAAALLVASHEAPAPGAPLQALSAIGDGDLRQAERCCRQALQGASVAPMEVVLAAGAARGRTLRIRVLALGPPGQAPRQLAWLAEDVSEQARIAQRLHEREREQRSWAENSPDNVIRYGPDLRATYCSPGFGQRVAIGPDELLGLTPEEAAPPGNAEAIAYHEAVVRALAHGERGTLEMHVPGPSGDMLVHHIAIAPERDPQGCIRGVIAVGRDMTPLVQARQRAQAAEREFRTLAENAQDSIVRWSADGRIAYVNPALLGALRCKRGDLLGKTLAELDPGRRLGPLPAAVDEALAGAEPRLLELAWQPLPGQRRRHDQVWLVPERSAEGQVVSVLGIGRDTTDAVEQRALIEMQARRDPLTALANRHALVERAAGVLAGGQRHGRRVGLLLADLDGFKAINDGLGHSAGDELLRVLAGRFVAALRPDDLLARLGGDEFVLLAPDLDSAAGAARVAEKLHGCLRHPVPVQGREVRVTASIGVALYPDDGLDFEQLMARADSAMYQAKRAGRSRTEFYTDAIGSAVQRRLALEQALRQACHGAGMALHFQPKVVVADDVRPIGAEALLRWRHPVLGAVSPAEFVPLAEETGLIVPLGAWVLQQAAAQAHRWNTGRNGAAHMPMRVAVNVSARQLAEPGFAQWVDETLRRSGCDPQWLELEITESVIAAGAAPAGQAVERLHALGLSIALDDFGTGFSALSYLTRFPVDTLKIDRSFVHALGGPGADSDADDRIERGRELVRAFIAMARALNLSLVAEGVETPAQAAFLRDAGCPVMQGWHFGPAAPAETFERDWLPDRRWLAGATATPTP